MLVISLSLRLSQGLLLPSSEPLPQVPSPELPLPWPVLPQLPVPLLHLPLSVPLPSLSCPHRSSSGEPSADRKRSCCRSIVLRPPTLSDVPPASKRCETSSIRFVFSAIDPKT
jgi:hypothetical protein